ncbi:MAG: AAA family ATPase [Bacilli bacterium]
MIEILIKNIGRIKSAHIKLEDITIVAGINNTGKSTISKILYSGIKPYSEIGRERVCTEISDEIVNDLNLLSEEFKETQNELIMSIYTELKNKKYTSLLRRVSELYSESKLKEKEDEEKVLHILEKLTIKDTTILRNYLINDLGELLDDENSKEKIKITKDKKDLVNYYHPENEEGELGKVQTRLSMPLMPKSDIYNIIYISTPYILEKIKFPSNYLTMIEEDFMNDFQRNYFTKGVINLNKKKSELKKIEEEIEKIIQGALILKGPQEIKYLCSDKKEVSLDNTATGIKSLGMLLKLLTNDSIKEDTILIFDEPEVHLHPEWQVKLAAILTMLVKALNIKLFINSHSSEFIEAIQVFALKEKILGIHTYLAKEIENKIIFLDKTKEFGSIFEELGKGYDILDKIKEEIEDYDI